jgi:hypothetical protein
LRRWVAGVSREAVHAVACRRWWRLLVSSGGDANALTNLKLPITNDRGRDFRDDDLWVGPELRRRLSFEVFA